MPHPSSLAVVVSRTTSMAFTDREAALAGGYDLRFVDKYRAGRELDPVVFAHPGVVLEDGPARVYSVDGMHRIFSAIEAGRTSIPCAIIVRRQDLRTLVPAAALARIDAAAASTSWFHRYQTIQEVGLVGMREQASRFPAVFDLSFLRGRTVADFGGNIGQLALEAYFNGAYRVTSFEYQAEAVATGQLIARTLGLSTVQHVQVDFNAGSFEEDVLRVLPAWDWAGFTAIYRTREIRDVRKLFDFVVEHAAVGIIFEGHADPTVDTDEYIRAFLAPYNFASIEYVGTHQLRRCYILRKRWV